jgi:salicylate hydroxylase
VTFEYCLVKVLMYSQRNGQDYVLDIFWPDEGAKPSSANPGTQWTACAPETLILEDHFDARSVQIPITKCSLLYEHLNTRFRALVKMTYSLTRVRYTTRRHPVTEWIDDSGRIVDIGDAAHPLLVPIYFYEDPSCVLTFC